MVSNRGWRLDCRAIYLDLAFARSYYGYVYARRGFSDEELVSTTK